MIVEQNGRVANLTGLINLSHRQIGLHPDGMLRIVGHQRAA
jgi:hypothetical protein